MMVSDSACDDEIEYLILRGFVCNDEFELSCRCDDLTDEPSLYKDNTAARKVITCRRFD